MSFYGDLAATALRLLTDKGQSLVIRRIAKTFDPVASETSAATKDTGTIIAVAVPFNTRDKERMDERLAEALTKGRLRKLVVAAQGVSYPPLPLDIITFESEPWTVAGVTPVNPAGTPIVYHVIIEKGALSVVDAAATEV